MVPSGRLSPCRRRSVPLGERLLTRISYCQKLRRYLRRGGDRSRKKKLAFVRASTSNRSASYMSAMSLFSKIKQGRKAAKDHKAAEKEKEEMAAAKKPYKHVPTHAAVDALSGAPSSWKHEDRTKIKEHHHRRSKMALSRTASNLSTALHSNNSAGGSQVYVLPRNASYSGYNPTWHDRTGDLYYSNEPRDRRAKSSKHHSYHDSGVGPSPLGSHVQSEEASPVNSSGNSTTSSSDNLPEIQMAPKDSNRPQPLTFAEKDIFQRLHTSTTRKLGEAPLSSPPKPKVIAQVATQEVKPKKQRWSFLNKRNSIAAV